MPKVKIDGIEIEVPAGFTVLQACELAGVEIPRFCYHERLSIAGNCRMCLVEVKPGPPKPQASCALPVADKQEIFTNTPMVAEGAQGRDGIPADQPSARLPDLRPGRRVRPAGPGDGLRLRPQPLPREQARGARQGAGPAGQDVDEPLHPLHALHPLRHRGGGRRGAGRDRPRRGHGDHDLCRACAHHRAGRQSGRSLPGRRADLQALRLRGPVVGAAPRPNRSTCWTRSAPISASTRAARR